MTNCWPSSRWRKCFILGKLPALCQRCCIGFREDIICERGNQWASKGLSYSSVLAVELDRLPHQRHPLREVAASGHGWYGSVVDARASLTQPKAASASGGTTKRWEAGAQFEISTKLPYGDHIPALFQHMSSSHTVAPFIHSTSDLCTSAN